MLRLQKPKVGPLGRLPGTDIYRRTDVYLTVRHTLSDQIVTESRMPRFVIVFMPIYCVTATRRKHRRGAACRKWMLLALKHQKTLIFHILYSFRIGTWDFSDTKLSGLKQNFSSTTFLLRYPKKSFHIFRPSRLRCRYPKVPFPGWKSGTIALDVFLQL